MAAFFVQGHLAAFFVQGHPQHQGNLVPMGRGRPGVRDKNAKKLHPWRDEIRRRAREEYQGDPVDGPVGVMLSFYMLRPSTHFGSGRNSHIVKASAPRYPATRPDIDKLERAVLDAGTGVLWADDGRIVAKHSYEHYVNTVAEEGVRITVVAL